MDRKVCIKCKQEKSTDDMATYRKNGETRLRNVCKACHNQQTSKNKIDKTAKVTKTVKAVQKEPIRELKTECNHCFIPDEIKFIKDLYQKRNEMQVNNKLITTYEPMDKSSRNIKSFNMDDAVMEYIKNESSRTKLSTSDIVNSIIRKAIDLGTQN